MRIFITWLLLVWCLMGSPFAHTTAMWQTLPPMLEPAQEIYPALHNGKIYVAGGLSDSISMAEQQMSAKVQIFDLQTQDWSWGPNLPEPRHHAYLVSVQQQLFLFGGFVKTVDGRWRASADILRLDEQQQQWINVAVLPKPLTETTIGVINDKVHFAAGRSPSGEANAQWRDQHDVNWHWIFDPKTLKTMEAPPLPIAFNSATAVVLDAQWYVIGGRQVGGANLAHVMRFDAVKQQWQTMADLPQAQGGLAAAVLFGEIWVFGGEYFTDNGGVYAEVWVYQPLQNQWRQQGTMPVPRHGLGAITFNDAIYVLGGATEVGLKATSKVSEKLVITP